MKLSDKQALILLDIAKWATQVAGGVAGYSQNTIHCTVNDIINQQDNTPRELNDKSQKSNPFTEYKIDINKETSWYNK
jgi:hypothetical protein